MLIRLQQMRSAPVSPAASRLARSFRSRAVSAVAALGLLLAGVVFAQAEGTSGILRGRVVDDQGGAIPGATVLLSPAARPGESLREISSRAGRYRFPDLPPGEYTLRVEMDGFDDYSRDGFLVVAGETTEWDPVLEVPSLSESVSVETPLPEVDLRKSRVSTNLRFVEVHPKRWPIFDAAFGAYRTERRDLFVELGIPDADVLPATSRVFGGAVGMMWARHPERETTAAVFGRAAVGAVHNNWFGVVFDFGLVRLTPKGFWGGGAGVWGLGDLDVTDVGLFFTQGFDTRWRTKDGPVQLFYEARLFARQLGNIGSNFSLNGGVRVNWRPRHRVEIR